MFVRCVIKMNELYKTCQYCGLSKYRSHFETKGNSLELQNKCTKCKMRAIGKNRWKVTCAKCNRYIRLYLDGLCRKCTPNLKCKQCQAVKPKSDFNGLTYCQACAISRKAKASEQLKKRLANNLEELRTKILQ